MTFLSLSRQVVLQELFDDSSEPTIEEIKEYASKIGIDVNNEVYLLPLARDFLMQPLPTDWKPCYDADRGNRIYYFNFKRNQAQWVHPLEEEHRKLVAKAKVDNISLTVTTDQADEDSRTTAKEDLKSCEEVSHSDSQQSDMISKPRVLEPLAPLAAKGTMRKPPATLGPLKMVRPALSNEARSDSKKVTFNESEVKKRPNSSDIRNRRNIGPMEFRHLSKEEIMSTHGQWRDEGYVTESSITQPPQLTLTGGGTMFLKKTNHKWDSESSPKKLIDLEEKEPNHEDERKIVRFKLEKDLKVNFEIPEVKDIVKPAPLDFKQIELDFEDLNIDLNTAKVPKATQKTALMNDHVLSSHTNEDKSSRCFKKSINIVLNGKSSFGTSQEHEGSDNLIDWTVDSQQSEASLVIPDLEEADLSNNKIPDVIEIHDQSCTQNIEAGGNFTSIDKAVKEQELRIYSNLERGKHNLELAKADKLKVLEGEFNNWVKNTEKMFRDKENSSYNSMKEKYEDWKKNEENIMIKEMRERFADELQGKVKALRNELLKQEQEELDHLNEQTRERLRTLREEVAAQEEQQLAELSKSLKENLLQRKDQLYQNHQEEMARLEQTLEAALAEQRLQREQELEKAREDEAALAAMRAQLKDAYLEQRSVLQQEHEMALKKLRQQNQVELRLSSVPARSLITDKDESDQRVYEKLRCEKRLLEDKYKTLKEKYIRLNADVKQSLERKAKKQIALSTSETERSTCTKKLEKAGSPQLRRKPDLVEKKLKLKKQLSHLDNVNQNISMDTCISKNAQRDLSSSVECEGARGGEVSSGEELHDGHLTAFPRNRKQLFFKVKAASTSRLNASLHNHKDDVLSPVENLRRQLKKLEELEDQFPVSNHTDTYLRYPFSDAPAPPFASSELEFFKHRIHLERDAVRRAKEFLKTQKKCYENRQKELQHRLMDGGPSSRSIVEQIHQEERELTEMEVSVHRTRALLGEKIIRLRHLENSLRRVAPERRTRSSCPSRDDATLSDLSSHSDSSGFSSTHHTSEIGPRSTLDKNKKHLQASLQESSEIIHSLENLNSEIRGIWEVLKKSAGPGAVQLPPPPLAWPSTKQLPMVSSSRQIMTQVSSVGHVTAVPDSSLVERTKSLRDWLKSARRSSNTGNAHLPNQVTL